MTERQEKLEELSKRVFGQRSCDQEGNYIVDSGGVSQQEYESLREEWFRLMREEWQEKNG